MDFFCIRVPLLDVSYPSTLFPPSTLNDRKSNDPYFKASTKVMLLNGEEAVFLGDVEMEDDKGDMKQHLCLGEIPAAPF